jgi:hypothetical protein
MTDLIELKLEFVANQMPDIERYLAAFIANHPILRDLPQYNQNIAAHCAAQHLLLSIPAQMVVGLVR